MCQTACSNENLLGKKLLSLEDRYMPLRRCSCVPTRREESICPSVKWTRDIKSSKSIPTYQSRFFHLRLKSLDNLGANEKRFRPG